MADIAADIRAVHAQTADDLQAVGPDAPSGLEGWNAAALAAHLLSQTGASRFGLAAARWVLMRGVRLGGDAGPRTNERAIRIYGRRSFDTAVQAVRRGPPFPLLAKAIAPLALYEIWVHDDDLRRANNLGPGIEPASLTEAVDFIRRYQRKLLGDTAVDTSMSPADQLRWLSGRPSSIPPHDPPLSI
jgi:uncharacterized protein (TIGR03083 family)